MTRTQTFACVIAFALSATACNDDATPASTSVATTDATTTNAKEPIDVNFAADNDAWRKQRREKLLQPDGWASLIGLHWIEMNSHYVGSGPTNGLRLGIGPDKLGLLQKDNGRVFLTPERGVPLTLDGAPLTGRTELKSDAEGTPSVVGFDEGKGLATVIKRGDRLALRVKHADAEARTQFTKLDYFDADPSWRIKGTFEPHPPGKTIEIASIIGTLDQMANPGVVVFERDGKTYRLEAVDEGDDQLFLILADRTSGHDTYGAGRYIYTDMPDANGNVVVDFNRAYNPPCVFTAFATCPLPPNENRLDLAVNAGEKNYAKAAP